MLICYLFRYLLIYLPVYLFTYLFTFLVINKYIIHFLSTQADVLIATTVIENGVDMPNVNTIIVLSADR